MQEYQNLCNQVKEDVQNLNKNQNLENLRNYLVDSECLSNLSEEIFGGFIYWPQDIPDLNSEAEKYLDDHYKEAYAL